MNDSSRKRQADMQADDASSHNGIPDTLALSSTATSDKEETPPKIQRSEGPGELGSRPSSATPYNSQQVNYQGSCHKYIVQINNTDKLLPSTPSMALDDCPSDSSNPRRPSSSAGILDTKELRFYCKLKDNWVDRYNRLGPRSRRRPRKVKIGDPGTDCAVTSLELQGFCMQEILHKGQFGMVLLSYSQLHRQNVTVKCLYPDPAIHRSTSWETSLDLMNVDISARVETTACHHSNGVDDRSTSSPPRLKGEVDVLPRLQHENIVQLIDHYFVNGRVCLILEFCENHSLHNLLCLRPGRLLPEAVAWRYFRDMLAAVDYLHGQCFVHRGICCNAFLLDHRNRVKLCDFASATEFRAGDPPMKHPIGSGSFVAPEVIEFRPYDPRLVDIWCLGVVLFCLVAGRAPFGQQAFNALTAMRKGIDFSVAAPSVVLSRDLRSLLWGILNYSPEDRFTLKRIQHSAWCQDSPSRSPAIGNYFLVQQPQKRRASAREARAKTYFRI